MVHIIIIKREPFHEKIIVISDGLGTGSVIGEFGWAQETGTV